MENTDIKLSCLITNYNGIQWIEQAVDSILKQEIGYTYEIVICDDGSDDGSLELIRNKYGSLPQVRILVQDRDRSVKEFANWRHSRAIFRLLDEARGGFLSILDGDDFFCTEDHFRRKIEILEREENRDCVACYGNRYELVDGKMQLYTARASEGKYHWLDDMTYITLATAVIRKEALQNVPRDIFYEGFVDWTITTWLAHQGDFYFTTQPCFVYRILQGSISHSVNEELKALRRLIGIEVDCRAYGERGLRQARRCILRLYNCHDLQNKIDCEMWSAYTVKYHAEIAYMLLNRKALPVHRKLKLLLVSLTCGQAGYRIKGYAAGIKQLCSSETSGKRKRELLGEFLARVIARHHQA